MGRTGPTPKPGGDTRRRAPSPTASDDVVLGSPKSSWDQETTSAWRWYANSQAAKLLRAEDVPAVLRLFDRIDKLGRLWAAVPDDPNDAERALRSVRILDAMVARGCAELGIGPLARARLGIGAAPKQRSALDDFMGKEDGDD